MGEQSGSWLFLVGIAIFVIALLGIGIFRSIKVLQNPTRPPARLYPVVFPMWKTNKLLWGGGCMTLLGLLLIGAGWFAQREHIRQIRLLESETVTTMARITNKTTSSHESNTTYYINYAFTAMVDDRPVELNHETSVPGYFYHRFERGDDLLVVYARSEPRITRIQALYTPGKVEYWRLTIPGGVGLFWCFLAWGAFSNYGTACRLDNEGVQATVRVLECYMVGRSDSRSYYVVYELPGFGPVRQSVGTRRYRQLTVGDLVKLTYLPDRPRVFRVEWE